jgi:hypothetical protein
MGHLSRMLPVSLPTNLGRDALPRTVVETHIGATVLHMVPHKQNRLTEQLYTYFKKLFRIFCSIRRGAKMPDASLKCERT